MILGEEGEPSRAPRPRPRLRPQAATSVCGAAGASSRTAGKPRVRRAPRAPGGSRPRHPRSVGACAAGRRRARRSHADFWGGPAWAAARRRASGCLLLSRRACSRGGVVLCGMRRAARASSAGRPCRLPGRRPPGNAGRCSKVSLRNRHRPGSPAPEQWVLSAAPFRRRARHHDNHPVIESRSRSPPRPLLSPAPLPRRPRRMVCGALAAVVKRRHLFVSGG